MKKISLILFFCASFIGVGLMYPTGVKATQILPIKAVFTIDPNSTYSDTIRVINDTDEPRNLIPVAQNFKPDPKGTNVPWFYENVEKTDERIALASWITFEQKIITLQPREEYKLPYTISVPGNAGPGGHYGALLFLDLGTEEVGDKTAADILKEMGAQVSVQSEMGTLLIMTVSGDVDRQSSVAFSTKEGKRFYSSLPVDFVTRVTNAGNIHTRPYGDVLIRNWFGTKKISLPVNEKHGFVLPTSTRNLENRWQWHELAPETKEIVKEFKNFGFGKYTAELLFVHDEGWKNDVMTVTFWVFPWQLILAVILLLLIIYFGIIRPYNKMVGRRYAKKQAMKAQGAAPAAKK